MSSTSALKNILIIGLAHPPPASMKAMLHSLGIAPETIGPRALQSLEAVSKAGFSAESVLITPDEGEGNDGLDKLEGKMQEKSWTGIMVGFGVRGTPEYTTTFEKVMDLSMRRCPGVKVGFNSRPDDLYDAIVRNFGD